MDFGPNLTGASHPLDPRAREGASCDSSTSGISVWSGELGDTGRCICRGSSALSLPPSPGPSPAWGQQRPSGPAAEALGAALPSLGSALLPHMKVSGHERGAGSLPLPRVQPSEVHAGPSQRGCHGAAPGRGADTIVSSSPGSRSHIGAHFPERQDQPPWAGMTAEPQSLAFHLS